MDIKIITLHSICNPGSALQAYALQKYLSFNHQVEIIDYRPDYSRKHPSFLKNLLRNVLFYRSRLRELKKYDNFMNSYMKLTKRCSSYGDLEKAGFVADYFIAGSDQLWNTSFPCGNDDAYYLNFTNIGKKISYSTSVGKKIIDEFNMDRLKKELGSFESLAVREKSTSIQLSSQLNRSVQWVCDPVFLLGKDEYLEFIDSRLKIKKPYVLVYLSPKSENLDKIVSYCRKKGLSIVLGGGFSKRCDCDIFLHDMGPEDFLSLIYHSELVVSTSFHATAFCHIFHKNFITMLPKKNGERIMSLLELTNLKYKSLDVTQSFDSKVIDENPNWDAVDEKLADYIDNSKKWLKKHIV